MNAPKVDVIDTNGAGDIFAGAFLHRLIQQNSYIQAGQFATTVASNLIQHFGPRLNKIDYLKLENAFTKNWLIVLINVCQV